jgi:hypothetical protein
MSQWQICERFSRSSGNDKCCTVAASTWTGRGQCESSFCGDCTWTGSSGSSNLLARDLHFVWFMNSISSSSALFVQLLVIGPYFNKILCFSLHWILLCRRHLLSDTVPLISFKYVMSTFVDSIISPPGGNCSRNWASPADMLNYEMPQLPVLFVPTLA